MFHRPASTRLRDLTGVIYDGFDPVTKEALFTERRQLRGKDKPVIREWTEGVC